MSFQRIHIQAAAILDGDHCAHAPGALLLEGDTIVAAGAPSDLGEIGSARRIDLPAAAIIPALVNAHCHLDLSHLAPEPFSGSFTEWIDGIRSRRAADDDAVGAATRRGIDLSLAGGIAAVGDIAGMGSLTPLQTLRASPLGGVSYLEVFGLGDHQARAVDFVERTAREEVVNAAGVRLGLQPHAPYSCGPEVYRAAALTGLPLSTHLAETLEELEFLASATGPLADMIRSFGAWNEGIEAFAAHPVDHLLEFLSTNPTVCAHLNYLDDAHLARLASTPTTVAYCPRASAYFGHPAPGHPPHRYRELLDAGINVALGTDGLPCLDTPGRISVLDEMRFLHRRDGVDGSQLLRMATINGAKALGLDIDQYTLTPGPIAGLLAIDIEAGGDDPLRVMLDDPRPPRWICGPGATGTTIPNA